MKTSHDKGLWAEGVAKAYFMLKGYRILAERFKTPYGEIDLVVQKENTVAFVEVKARKTETDAAEAIHAQNQARVRQAAALYLQQHPEYNDCELRFDACLLGKGGVPRHLEGAWD